MISLVYIQEYGNGKIEPEQKLLLNEFKSRGVPTQLFTRKLMDRRRLELSSETLVAGEVDVVLKALKYIGIEGANKDSYPKSLKSFYHRDMWESDIRSLTNQLYDGDLISSVFVKPKEETKKFTGFVLDSIDDLRLFKGASKSTKLYCANPISWLSEYRVYVIDGKIMGVEYYEGDEKVLLDMNVVKEAINVFETSDEKTIAYGIDFGVLGNGKTAFIEWNDGFSLGSYGLSQEIYTDLIIARWNNFFERG